MMEVVRMEKKEVLDGEEVADLLSVSPWTVREQARLGRLPGRKVGKEWRFSRQGLLEWLREGIGTIDPMD